LTANEIQFAKRFSHKIDEQPSSRNAPHARSIEQVDGRRLRRFPVRQRSDQSAGGELRQVRPIENADHAMARERQLDDQVAVRVAGGEPATRLDRLLL